MRTRIVCLFMLMLSLVACGGSSASSTTTGDSLAAPLPASPLFLLSGLDETLVIVDTATHQVVKTITHPDLRGSRQFAVTPDGMMYIALNMSPEHVYDEIMVVDAHTGSVVAQIPTDPSPMSPRWIGNNTVLVGHTAILPGGFDMVLIDTTHHTITHRFKYPTQLVDAVAIGDVVYLSEHIVEGSSAVVAYDIVRQTILDEWPMPNAVGNLIMQDTDVFYAITYANGDGAPCQTGTGTIHRIDPQTGTTTPIGSLKVPDYPNGLTIPSATTVLVLDTCPDMDHANLIVFDSSTGAEQARRQLPRHVKLTMSQVTPQGEIAIFYEDGRIHWYAALTLEPRGHTEIPMRWVSDMMLYPTEAHVR